MGKHIGDKPSDIEYLAGAWHVGRSWPGMFPFIEQSCPCPKATCGLAVPIAATYCEEHHGARTLRQAHRADDCEQWKKRHRRR